MMAAAARLFDLEQCPGSGPMPSSICQIPQVLPHVGGIILGKGSPDVNINGRPAARCGDRTICAGGGAIDIIVTGPKDVFINGRLAAAVGSKIDHKAVVITGSADVNYGDEMDGATLGDSKAATEACQEAALKRNFGERQGKPMNCGRSPCARFASSAARNSTTAERRAARAQKGRRTRKVSWNATT